MADERQQTEGEWRVGVSFNPSANPIVDEIKKKSAELIDLVLAAGGDGRSAALAATHYEDAAMWAVKAVTKYLR